MLLLHCGISQNIHFSRSKKFNSSIMKFMCYVVEKYRAFYTNYQETNIKSIQLCYRNLRNHSFWTLLIVQNSKSVQNTTFRKPNLLPSSGEGSEKCTLMVLLKGANLNQWSIDPLSQTLCFLIIQNSGQQAKYRNPKILSVIHHRQNHLDSVYKILEN